MQENTSCMMVRCMQLWQSYFGESAGRQLEYPTNNEPDNGLTVSRKQIQFNKQM